MNRPIVAVSASFLTSRFIALRLIGLHQSGLLTAVVVDVIIAVAMTMLVRRTVVLELMTILNGFHLAPAVTNRNQAERRFGAPACASWNRDWGGNWYVVICAAMVSRRNAQLALSYRGTGLRRALHRLHGEWCIDSMRRIRRLSEFVIG